MFVSITDMLRRNIGNLQRLLLTNVTYRSLSYSGQTTNRSIFTFNFTVHGGFLVNDIHCISIHSRPFGRLYKVSFILDHVLFPVYDVNFWHGSTTASCVIQVAVPELKP